MAFSRRALSPQRSLDVIVTIELYEIIGRRPSVVYLDHALKPIASADGPHRLNELVYQRGCALPGEQIHLASGRTFVLDVHNVYRGVLVVPPRPISSETALTHSGQDRAAEESKIEALVLAGSLIDARPRRSQSPTLPRYDRMYVADQPLIADAS
jgi:hypothetical protein